MSIKKYLALMTIKILLLSIGIIFGFAFLFLPSKLSISGIILLIIGCMSFRFSLAEKYFFSMPDKLKFMTIRFEMKSSLWVSATFLLILFASMWALAFITIIYQKFDLKYVVLNYQQDTKTITVTKNMGRGIEEESEVDVYPTIKDYRIYTWNHPTLLRRVHELKEDNGIVGYQKYLYWQTAFIYLKDNDRVYINDKYVKTPVIDRIPMMSFVIIELTIMSLLGPFPAFLFIFLLYLILKRYGVGFGSLR